MVNYVFDVDGTVTPSRNKINQQFEKFFEHFCTHNAVYFVTGSDRDKTINQLGSQIYNLAIRVYQCSGNDVWQQSNNIHTSNIIVPVEMEKALNKEISNSKFMSTLRNGNHIDIRPGMINLSIPGHGCSMENRYHFRQFDEATNERHQIASRLSEQFPHYNFQVAGETGIDIVIKGADKSQILKDFKPTDIIHFYGDKCQPGGNDYEIATAIGNLNNGSVVHEVTGWEDTWQKLT